MTQSSIIESNARRSRIRIVAAIAVAAVLFIGLDSAFSAWWGYYWGLHPVGGTRLVQMRGVG